MHFRSYSGTKAINKFHIPKIEKYILDQYEKNTSVF